MCKNSGAIFCILFYRVFYLLDNDAELYCGGHFIGIYSKTLLNCRFACNVNFCDNLPREIKKKMLKYLNNLINS